MYVSFQDDDSISIFTVDPATGTLDWQAEVAVDGGPAPLAIDPGKNFLYVGRRAKQEISSYRIDQSTGGLALIGTAPLQGEPVCLATDRTGRFVLSAYYYQSTAAVHAVNSSGVATFPPIEWRYTAGGAHAIQTDRSNRFAFVPHIANRGPNAIFQFKFDENTGRLTPNVPDRYSPQEYLGPRHFCFHPNLDIVYFSDEQGSSVTLVLGGRSAEQLFPAPNLAAEVEVVVTTEDGSLGRRGLATEAFADHLEWCDQAFACGPNAMFQALAEAMRRRRVRRPVQVLLEEGMACGTAICYGCAVETKRGIRLVCRDGPQFDLRDLF